MDSSAAPADGADAGLVGLAMHKLTNRLRLVMSHEQNNESLSRAMTMALLALGALVFAKRPLEEAHKC